jgi:plasmid stabilization system protein ParE
VSRGLVVRPEVEAELPEAAEWYEVRAFGLAAEFLRAVDACMASVMRNPFQYPIVHEGKRRALVRRFPYSLIYVASEQKVLILACLHGRRHPMRWQQRR